MIIYFFEQSIFLYKGNPSTTWVLERGPAASNPVRQARADHHGWSSHGGEETANSTRNGSRSSGAIAGAIGAGRSITGSPQSLEGAARVVAVLRLLKPFQIIPPVQDRVHVSLVTCVVCFTWARQDTDDALPTKLGHGPHALVFPRTTGKGKMSISQRKS